MEKIRTKYDNKQQQSHQNIKQKSIKTELLQQPQNNGFNNDIATRSQFQYLFEKNQIDDERAHNHHNYNHHQHHHQHQMNNIETTNQLKFSLFSNSKNIKLPDRNNLKNNSTKYSQQGNNWSFLNNNNGLDSSSNHQQNKLNDNLNLLNNNNNILVNKFPTFIHPSSSTASSSSSSSSSQQQHHYQQPSSSHHHQHIDQNNNNYSDLYGIQNNQFINIHNILSNHELKKKQHVDTSFIDINKPLDFSCSNSSSTQLLQNTSARELSIKQKLLNEPNTIDLYLPQPKKFKNDPFNIKPNNNDKVTTTTQQQRELEYENSRKKCSTYSDDYLNESSPQQHQHNLNEDKNKFLLKHENSPHSLINLNESTEPNQNIDNLNINNKQNINKLKPKPLPLKIPSTISTFQYPNMTLLKSPHFSETKNQYTPPPMLSPFRKAPGLYANCFNTKQFYTAFSVPAGRLPGLLSTSTNSMINIQNSNSNSTQTSVNNELNNSNTNSKDLILTGCSFKTEGFTPQLSTPKPSLLRSRSTRISVTSSASSFFPDEINDVDSDDKTKP